MPITDGVSSAYSVPLCLRFFSSPCLSASVVNIHPESASIRGMLLPFQFRTTPDDLGIRSKVSSA